MSYAIQCISCYGISIVLAFSCGRAETFRIRQVWTRISSKTGEKHLRFQKYPDTWTGYCEWKIMHLLRAQKWGSWILNTSSIWFTYEMKSTNKDQSSYLWKLSIIKDFGLAHNAIYPWNISSPFSQRRPQRDGHLRKTGKWSCCLLLLMSFSKEVFAGAKHVNRKKTFCILGKWFCTHFRVNRLFKSKDT